VIEHLTKVMVQSGAEWVLWLLFALSVGSVFTFVERLWSYRLVAADASLLIPELHKLLRAEEYGRVQQLLSQSDNVVAKVASAGLAEATNGPQSAEQAMTAVLGVERAFLEKRLMYLGTVGNNAPFVGLLGTVIGVVGAFDELGRPQAMTSAMNAASALAPERVMGTIAEALVATAVGLIVAIPAVAAFNYLQGRVTRVLADAQTIGSVVLAHLSREVREPNLPAHPSLADLQKVMSPQGHALQPRPRLAAE
jgi:biopolymer transport protein ExbB